MDWSNLLSGGASLLTGGAFGAITGIIGSGVTAFIKHRKQKQDQAHEKEMRLMDHEDMKLEAELQIKRTEATADAEKSVEETKAFKMSLKGANESLFKKEYMQDLPAWVRTIIALLLAIVDVINKTVRPAITYYFLFKSSQILNKVIENEAMLTKVTPDTVVATFLYLMVTAVTWWLGQRPMDKMMDKIIPA